MERQISRTVALLVDDDLGILFVMAQLIEEAGYAVRTAANGEAALAILSSTDIIDLVISDIVMPGMDGIAFAERAQAIRPGIRLALISGHVQKVRIGLDVTVFEKPFRPTDLLQWLASQSTQADAPPPFPADRSSLRRRGGSG